MARTHRRQSSGSWIFLLVVLLVGAGVYFMWPGEGGGGDANAPTGGGPDGGIAGQRGEDGTGGGGDIEPNSVVPAEIIRGTGEAASQAESAFRAGVSRVDAEPYEARRLINEALLSGRLDASRARQARRLLGQLAGRLLLNGTPAVREDDPYTLGYTFRPNEYLGNTPRRKGVISRLELWIPAEGIVLANGLASATQFQYGRKYKMVRGPCRAVVDLSDRTMDVYLCPPDAPPLFLRRMPVGIGAPETPTPTGTFVVSGGGKVLAKRYYPPAGRGSGVIQHGDPDYPLDDSGRFIQIEGIEGTDVSVKDGYALHGTSEPESIGQAESLGCIRLRSDDIAWVWAMLYETKSTITIKE
jgi:hypothetical protein